MQVVFNEAQQAKFGAQRFKATSEVQFNQIIVKFVFQELQNLYMWYCDIWMDVRASLAVNVNIVNNILRGIYYYSKHVKGRSGKHIFRGESLPSSRPVSHSVTLSLTDNKQLFKPK